MTTVAVQASLLKTIIKPIKNFVTKVKFVCSSTEISFKGNDSSNNVMMSMSLLKGFEHNMVDKKLSMGMDIKIMWKKLKCVDDDYIITIKADDIGDIVTFTCLSPCQCKIIDFDMMAINLVDTDNRVMGIHDNEYDASVEMSLTKLHKIRKILKESCDTGMYD